MGQSNQRFFKDFFGVFMNITNCKTCGHNREQIFTNLVLSKHDVKYFYCPNCGLVQTEDPFWISEAYSSGISNSNTGIFSRNLSLMK